MFTNLTRTAGPGSKVAAMAPLLDMKLMLSSDTDDVLVTIREGAVTQCTPGPHVMASYDTRLVATTEAWTEYLAAVPRPGYHDIFALLRAGSIRFEGNLLPMMQNLLYIKRLLASLRPEVTA
ncbi:hypothetical protein ATO6_19675 [Oceanicola sp. 22II-s10i]|uniref:hypothetical protein n=1 Tax=Oceanicola sp. 22II-s10i TaxID=1317116 RepID=UPI000B527A00|nr:hypothetical protein [Oceanicola sp. 22II-s10i]OWU83347.1 hypothetical protein ATO6_19675 [Oceanicola sp. 22II-s10i]